VGLRCLGVLVAVGLLRYLMHSTTSWLELCDCFVGSRTRHLLVAFYAPLGFQDINSVHPKFCYRWWTLSRIYLQFWAVWSWWWLNLMLSWGVESIACLRKPVWLRCQKHWISVLVSNSVRGIVIAWARELLLLLEIMVVNCILNITVTMHPISHWELNPDFAKSFWRLVFIWRRRSHLFHNFVNVFVYSNFLDFISTNSERFAVLSAHFWRESPVYRAIRCRRR